MGINMCEQDKAPVYVVRLWSLQGFALRDFVASHYEVNGQRKGPSRKRMARLARALVHGRARGGLPCYPLSSSGVGVGFNQNLSGEVAARAQS